MRKYQFMTVIVFVFFITSTVYANIMLEVTQFDSTQNETKGYQFGIDMGSDFSNNEVSIVIDEGLASESVTRTKLVKGKAMRYVDFAPVGGVYSPSTVTLIIGNKKYLDKVSVESIIGVSTKISPQQYTIVNANSPNLDIIGSNQPDAIGSDPSNVSHPDFDLTSNSNDYYETDDNSNYENSVAVPVKLDDSGDRRYKQNLLIILALFVSVIFIIFVIKKIHNKDKA